MFKGICVDFIMKCMAAHCDNIGTLLQGENLESKNIFNNSLDLGVYSNVYYACIITARWKP